MTRGGSGEAGGRWRRRENDQHWFILAVFLSGWCRQNTSLHPIPSHYLPADHRSPTSFLQGHKYFPRTPYCFHIILQTPPNDSERQTMHPFSHDCHPVLCSYTFYSGWRTYTYTTRGQQRCVPQTLHLKWYIKATCLKILHMIDVGNDSVSSVWKSHVCFSLHLRSPRKENVRALEQTEENKKGGKTILSIIRSHGNRTMHSVKYFQHSLMGRRQSITDNESNLFWHTGHPNQLESSTQWATSVNKVFSPQSFLSTALLERKPHS